jgi:UDP-N-acetylglucosamine 3-dehydrogenase
MKIGVIGTGSMGCNHIRVLKNIPEVDEIVIADINRENLARAAKRFSIQKAYPDFLTLIRQEHPDGLVIATLPDSHKEISIEAMKAGIAILVEKPVAHSLEDAEEMIRVAESTGVVFTVGHIERFNPVVAKIKDFIANNLLSNIYLINTHRIGPFPKRLLGKREGVLIDLAVHDLDIISYLCGPIKDIRSHILRTASQEIYVMALLDLFNEIKGSAEFSWISPRKVRSIEIFGDEGMILGDYLNQEVWFFENDDYDNNLRASEPYIKSGLVKSGKTIKYPLLNQEPLFLELMNFINTISGLEHVLIKPDEAKLALQYSLSIK